MQNALKMGQPKDQHGPLVRQIGRSRRVGRHPILAYAHWHVEEEDLADERAHDVSVMHAILVEKLPSGNSIARHAELASEATSRPHGGIDTRRDRIAGRTLDQKPS